MKDNKLNDLSDVLKSSEFKSWCEKSTHTVFESLFNTGLTVGATPLKAEAESTEISAVIAFMGTDIEATLQLSCSKQTIIQLVEKNYTGEFTETQSILFLGEAVNVIFGMLKEKLNLFGLYYEKCLPVVISGQNHLILNLSNGQIFSESFVTPYGVINLKAGLNNKAVFRKNVA